MVEKITLLKCVSSLLECSVTPEERDELRVKMTLMRAEKVNHKTLKLNIFSSCSPCHVKKKIEYIIIWSPTELKRLNLIVYSKIKSV